MKTMKIVSMFIMSVFANDICTAQVHPTVVVQRAIVINGVANASSLTAPRANMDVALTGVQNINEIGTAMQFHFEVNGVPVNVTDFYVTAATYTLVNSGNSTTWTNVPHGSYNPPGDTSRPDLLVYDQSGTKVSVDNTSVIGTHIPVMSKFQLLEQQITLGGVNRPKFSTVGQYYRLDRSWTFTYRYEGQQYTDSITPDQTSVIVRVFPDTDDFVPTQGSSGPYRIDFQISDDLVRWVTPPGVTVPYPRPVSVGGIIALMPSTVLVPGMSNSKRFYRFDQVGFTP